MMIGSLAVLTGCAKDDNGDGIPEGAMMLLSESQGSNGAKTSVSTTTVQWEEDDVVTIDGTNYTVKISGDGKAYTSTAVPEAAAHYAYYNCGTVTSGTTTPTVTIPSRYASSYSGGRQIIQLPMAAYSSSNTKTVTFKHLTAAMEVQVTNSTGFDGLYIDSVQVVSASQNLCGSVTIDLTEADYDLDPADGSNNTVTVYFDWQEVTLDNGSTLKVQVPILPIANKASDLTVKVYTHSKAATVLSKPGIAPANYDFNFSQTKAAPTLGRNVMSKAAVSVTNGTGNTTTVDHSLFTVASSGTTTQVHFSQGNLKRVSDTWSFHDNQYDVLGGWTASNCDLFYWETSGNYGSEENCVTSTGTSSDVVNWGDNAISNGGNVANAYSTPSTAQWRYLFNTRTDASSKYGAATVCGQNGVVILPDHWTLPNGCTFTSGRSYWNTNTYDATEWARMEAAGAVFLPAAGRRRNGLGVGRVGNYGHYWSSTALDNYIAWGVYFYSNYLDIGHQFDRNAGQSVRLVCE